MRRASPVFLFALLGVVGATAGEPGASPPAEGAVATAKRQFEAMKSDANSLGASLGASPDTARLPKVSLPELHATSPASAVPAAKPYALRGQNAEKTPGNWLVDAMMKPKPSDRPGSARRELDPLPRGQATGLFRGDDEDGESRPSFSASESSSHATREEAAADRSPDRVRAFNPLTRYMTDWLSPQNYALLRKSGDSSDSLPLFSDAKNGASDAPLGGSSLVGNPGGNGADFGGPDDMQGAVTKPPENPYLQSLAPMEQPSAVVPRVQASPEQRPAAPPAPVPSAERDEAKPRVPDFVKPVGDEKYFGPLKRF